MERRPDPAPEAVETLSERCVAHVRGRFGFELDYTHETLGVVDHFVRAVVADEGGGTAPPAGHPRRSHLVALLAPTVGSYFGEVLRRAFPCRWRLPSDDPSGWLLEFEEVLLRFNPLGAAAEALIEAPVEAWGGAMCTSPEDMPALADRLAQAPPLPERDFFSLASRFDAIQIVEDWLRGREAHRHRRPPWIYGPDEYDTIMGRP